MTVTQTMPKSVNVPATVCEPSENTFLIMLNSYMKNARQFYINCYVKCVSCMKTNETSKFFKLLFRS